MRELLPCRNKCRCAASRMWDPEPDPRSCYNGISPFDHRSSSQMFDLFRSREKGMRIMLGVMGGMLGLSMLTYLIPNYNTGGSTNDFIVAEIGKDPITLQEVQQL